MFDATVSSRDIWFMLRGAGDPLGLTFWAVLGGTLLGAAFGLLRASLPGWPSAALGQPGRDARSSPNAAPSNVPPSTAQNVRPSGSPAPLSMNQMSREETVASNIGGGLVAEQSPGDEAGAAGHDLGDEVIENSRGAEIFERAVGQHIQLLRHAGQIRVQADGQA